MKAIMIGFLVTAVIFSTAILFAISSDSTTTENSVGFSSTGSSAFNSLSDQSADLSIDCSYSFSKLSDQTTSDFASDYATVCAPKIQTAIFSCYAGLCEPQTCDLDTHELTVVCEVTP
jgi:hypothetical protein